MAEITTFKQAQAMRRARKAELDEFDAESMLRRLARTIPIPKSMAETQILWSPQARARWCMAKKAQMMWGGMANGKSTYVRYWW